MSKIRFITSKTESDVSFKQISPSVIDLVFTENVKQAELLGGFEVLNEYNGTVMGMYDTYTTIYRSFENALHFQLSNDASVYTEPEVPTVSTEATITFIGTSHLTLNPSSVKATIGADLSSITFPTVSSSDADYSFYTWSETTGKIKGDMTIFAYEQYHHTPTLEETKEMKRSEINYACENIIYAGVDVELTDETTEHFSLTEKDQLNLFGKQVQIASGASKFEYHQDGKPCKYYTSADMTKIIKASMEHVTFHTTYANAIHMWINGCSTKEDVEAIFYGAAVPEAYINEVLQDQKSAMDQFVAAVAAQK